MLLGQFRPPKEKKFPFGGLNYFPFEINLPVPD